MELYTDGSAGPSNPGPGGWAVTTKTQVLIVGHANQTTNNRMEGVALLEALRWLAGRPAVIRTDSQLWANTVNFWAAGWEARGWRKSNGDVPNNLDLVQPIMEMTRLGQAQVRWVRGHNGDPGNELADTWAGKARLQRLGHRHDMKPSPF